MFGSQVLAPNKGIYLFFLQRTISKSGFHLNPKGFTFVWSRRRQMAWKLGFSRTRDDFADFASIKMASATACVHLLLQCCYCFAVKLNSGAQTAGTSTVSLKLRCLFTWPTHSPVVPECLLLATLTDCRNRRSQTLLPRWQLSG